MHRVYPSIRCRLSRALSDRLRSTDPSFARLASRAPLLVRSNSPGTDFRLFVDSSSTPNAVSGALAGHPDLKSAEAVDDWVHVTLRDDAVARLLVARATGAPEHSSHAETTRSASLGVSWPATMPDVETSARVERVGRAWRSMLEASGVTVHADSEGDAGSDAPAVCRVGGADDPLTAPLRVAIGHAHRSDRLMGPTALEIEQLRIAPHRRVQPGPEGERLVESIARLSSMVRYGRIEAASAGSDQVASLMSGPERRLVIRLLSAEEAIAAGAEAGDASRPIREAGVVLNALAAYYPGFRYMCVDRDVEIARGLLARAVHRTALICLQSVGVTL